MSLESSSESSAKPSSGSFGLLRPLSPEDLDHIVHHRDQMFIESGRETGLIALMSDHFKAWLAPRLKDGSYFGYMIEDRGRIVGGIGLMALDWPPHPLHPQQDKRGYVLNLYIEPSHRGQGLGRSLMAAAEALLKARGLGYVILHPTQRAKPLYEALGFGLTSEMGKSL